jgi:hypothetical protein
VDHAAVEVERLLVEAEDLALAQAAAERQLAAVRPEGL